MLRNILEQQASAYLKQHASNPVAWQPWSADTLQLAKTMQRPIFLSIGYSTCHWCHVMAHESFEDAETAKFLNDNFICIKVDREEFPDVDRYYQDACQLFLGRGGWPLSAFLLPDQRPFFVGTYFPKTGREGAPSFKELTSELLRAFKEQRSVVDENAEKAVAAIQQGPLDRNQKIKYQGHFPHPMAITGALVKIKDLEHGSYGKAPKFPHHSYYEWAVEQILEGMLSDEESKFIINSLVKMVEGGMIDHVRGGMHRYSTDEHFTVPHFEKMLYDQAGLLRVLAKLGSLAPSPLIFDTLMNTLDYLEKEMLAGPGHLMAAQDADSEGVEGLYYCYTMEEFEDALANSDDEELIEKQDKVKQLFSITPGGNFEHALNVVRFPRTLTDEDRVEIYTPEIWNLIRKARTALWQSRKNRIPPLTDNKGLASWNFLTMSALVDVVQYCPVLPIKEKGGQLIKGLIEGMYQTFLVSKNPNEAMRLRHSTTLGTELCYFEDYVFFAETMLRLYELSATEVFKINFNETMTFILETFLEKKDDILEFKMRPVSGDSGPWATGPNQACYGFDSSYKSPKATMQLLLRRGAVLNLNNEWLALADQLKEDLTQETLRNPFACGEALRALTYPNDAFRVVKVPQNWKDEPEFLGIINYFLSRFVIDYGPEAKGENQPWQICNFQNCEMQGKTLKEFVTALTPQQA